MRCIRWYGRHDIRVDDVAPPGPPGPGEAQVRVLACGICGTDTAEYRDGPIFIPAGGPHPLTGKAPPVVLGHEVCGEVVAVGSGGDRDLVGRLVAVDGVISCGECWACRAHRVNLCPQLGSIGFSADGGLASHLNAPSRGCVPLPPGTSPDAGVLAEPLAVAVRALRRGRLQAGERVGVVGGGAVGLLAAQASAAMGASGVVLVEPDEHRRDLGRTVGIGEVVGPAGAAQVAADVVIECSGTESGVLASFSAARPTGRVVLLGIMKSSPPLPVLDVVRDELEVLGSLSHIYDEDFAQAVRLLGSGEVSTAPLVWAAPGLDEALGCITGARQAPAREVKILVHPVEGQRRG